MDTNNLCFGCFREHNNVGPCPHCGYDLATAKHPFVALPIGTILNGRYLTGRVLGVGGFGVTYLAFDMTLEIAVAVKEFLPSGIALRDSDRYTMTVSSPEEQPKFDTGATKFLDEARLLAKLRDVPNIVTVQDYFRENNTAYFVMEYIEGVDLMKYAQNKGGTLSYNEALYLILPVIDSLAHVHAHNLLHRDISPDNIVVMKNGSTRLLDFGAARVAIDTEKSKSIILKHGFAPEEQYRKHGNQGPWSDEYALAATMYLIITGVMPPDAIERVHEDTLVSPKDLGVDIPDYANDALMKALSVHASGRFPDMASFSVALTGNQPVGSSVSYAPSMTVSSQDAFPSGVVSRQDGPMVEGKTVGMEQDQISQPYAPQKMISPSILAGENEKSDAEEKSEVEKPKTKKKKSIWKRPVTYILMGIVALAIAAFPIGNYITENYEWGPTTTTAKKTSKKTSKETSKPTTPPSETIPDPQIEENGDSITYNDTVRTFSLSAPAKYSFTNKDGLFTLVRDDQATSIYINAVKSVGDFRVETLNDMIAQSEDVIKTYLLNTLGLSEVEVNDDYLYITTLGVGSTTLEFDVSASSDTGKVNVTFLAVERKADTGVFLLCGIMPIDDYGMYSGDDWEDIKNVLMTFVENSDVPSAYSYYYGDNMPDFLYNSNFVSEVEEVTIGNNLDCLDLHLVNLEDKECKVQVVNLGEQDSIANACTAAEQVLGANYKFGGYTSVTPTVRKSYEMRIRNYTLTKIYDEDVIVECTVCVINMNGTYYAVIATCDDDAVLERVTLDFTMVVRTLTD
ncbi:MAG: serine/threonine protein kinase [Clostridiales bacterium]|nr:serine/threonine protein kinase [Clostridiales bacterium]